MNDTVAWAAGLFEGEGCLRLTGRSVQAALAMTDEDVVMRFAKLVGASMERPYARPPHKTLYTCRLTGWAKVEPFMALIEPYMGLRRLQKIQKIRDAKPADIQPWNANKTHCKRGHRFTPENTLESAQSGGRVRRTCRTCTRSAQRARAKRGR